MIINTNIPALNNLRMSGINENNVKKDMEKLSSGQRINKAADDAAGLAISEKMRTQIRGLEKANQNIEDGVNTTKIGDGGLAEIHNIIHRCEELVVNSLNDANTDYDRGIIQKEIDELLKTIDKVANETNFNGITLLNRSGMDKVQSTLITPPVNSSGQFSFAAARSDGTQPAILVFGGGNTSYPKIKISDSLGNMLIDTNIENLTLSAPTTTNGTSWVTGYNYSAGIYDVTINQTVSIVQNPASLGGQSYEIRYDVVNNSSADINIDLMFHIDTMLGSNDAAPFKVNGNDIPTCTSYDTPSNLPSMIEIFDNVDNPFINGVIITSDGAGLPIITAPDKVNLGDYSGVAAWGFTSSSSAVGDSGYAVHWLNKTIQSGDTFSANTYYGVKNPSGVDSDWLIIQAGANQDEHIIIPLCDARISALNLKDIKLVPRNLGEIALGNLRAASEKVSGFRTNFGVSQNRLEKALVNVSSYGNNLAFAESRLRDAEMSELITEMSKNSLILQTSQALSPQINALAERMLTLLK